MREDIEAYRDHLLTEGRRRGGAAGTGLGARSVNLALGQLQAAWDLDVPDSLRAAWLGHTIAVNRGTYLHSRPEELAVISAALGQLFRAV